MKRKKAISVTVPYEIAEVAEKISKKEMKSLSTIVSEAIKLYSLRKEFEEILEDFSERASNNSNRRGYKQDSALIQERTRKLKIKI